MGAVVFDFDGVILQSADLKTDAFVELFGAYPEHLPRIRKHHLENEGISRYVKFEWIYRELLGREIEPEESEQLGEAFSRLVFEKVLACPFVPGARETLEALAPRFPLYVASGTPHEELGRIVRSRELEPLFTEVWGSPNQKADVLRSVGERRALPPEGILFVGDASSDYRAAMETGVRFVARATPDSAAVWEERGVRWVEDLHDLLSEVES